MKLEEIGFYTLSDYRVEQVNENSPLWRCELILTNRCNFKCTYCRGLKKEYQKDMTYEEAKQVLNYWIKEKVKNIRLSGGEPTLWKGLKELVKYAKDNGVERIALSTNGSNTLEFYKELVECGINDFSISLDACCASYADRMAGVNVTWTNLENNIKELSKLTYVTVGVVVTEDNVSQLKEIILYADSLGVSDIRIISAAQWNKVLDNVVDLPTEILNKYPILKYRINNIKNNVPARGLVKKDYRKCPLVMDDMAIVGNKHYPCIIYLREQGEPIGEVSDNMRKERMKWFENHNCFEDKICRENCLDVCVSHSNKYMEKQIEKISLPLLDSTMFDWQKYRNRDVIDILNVPMRYNYLIKNEVRNRIKKYAVGYCKGERLMCRPKTSEMAVMFWKDGEYSWFHIRSNEFVEIFT